MIFTVVLYVLAAVLLIVSFAKDKQKTKQALLKAWKSFENILPQLLTILLVIGALLAVLSVETTSRLLGAGSGVWGVLIAALVGSVTLIPGFVAFPLAAALLQNGAGYAQIAAFVSTLMMVGVVTIPVESKIMGRKATLARNALAFAFSLFVALVIGLVMK